MSGTVSRRAHFPKSQHGKSGAHIDPIRVGMYALVIVRGNWLGNGQSGPRATVPTSRARLLNRATGQGCYRSTIRALLPCLAMTCFCSPRT
jgi:hypothetical protein